MKHFFVLLLRKEFSSQPILQCQAEENGNVRRITTLRTIDFCSRAFEVKTVTAWNANDACPRMDSRCDGSCNVFLLVKLEKCRPTLPSWDSSCRFHVGEMLTNVTPSWDYIIAPSSVWRCWTSSVYPFPRNTDA